MSRTSCAITDMFWLISLFSSICLAQHNGSSFVPYIIGGENAVPHQFPFFAHIEISTPSFTGSCGGSLITPTSILTAAHCCECSATDTVFTVSVNAYTANGGTNEAIPDACTDTFVTTQKQCHPSYVQDGQTVHPEHDFCLLTLPRPSSYTPITLYDSSVIKVSPRPDSYKYNLLIIGFGIKDGQPVGSNTLQKAFQPVANSEECANKYFLNSFGQITFNTSLIMCGNTTGMKNTCQGDSGGPAFIKINGKFVLVGVTSGGVDDCFDTSYDALYGRVDVPSFKNWLYGTVYPTTRLPTGKPTRRPSKNPSTRVPTGRPSRRPTVSPSVRPTKRPSFQPTTRLPTVRPTTRRPTRAPSVRPTKYPTSFPTSRPTKLPTLFPSRHPTQYPTTRRPTKLPTTRVPTFTKTCVSHVYP